MKNLLKNQIIIDGLEYCNWNRELLENLWNGGITAVHVTLVYWESTEEAFKKITNIEQLIQNNQDIICQAKTTQDILNAKKDNKVAFIFGFQNSAPINNNIFLVEEFFNKGLRFMQLTYNNQTPLAGGCFELKDSGVSRFGKEVIEEMNRLGMIIDLSHAGRNSMLDAIEFSTKPVAISHANPSFFHESLRNIDDDVLKKLSEKKGFIGLSMYPYHIKNLGNCKIEEYCFMIKKLINLIGSDNIGIGSDLCLNWPDEVVMWMRNGYWTKKVDYGESKDKNVKWPKKPEWYQKPSDILNIFEAMCQNGVNEEIAIKIIGSNWFNFMKNHF